MPVMKISQKAVKDATVTRHTYDLIAHFVRHPAPSTPQQDVSIVNTVRGIKIVVIGVTHNRRLTKLAIDGTKELCVSV